jgi:predicted 2-oxoglutarate/Fe(II)-dependent dioxygenase YbiX
MSTMMQTLVRPTKSTIPPAPDQVLIVENFIDADLCRMFCEHAETQRAEKLTVLDFHKTTEQQVASTLDTRIRDSHRIMTDYLDDIELELFYNIFAQYVEPFFNLRIEWWEKPQFMRYEAGGRYAAHADNEQAFYDPDGVKQWTRTFDRDISVLLYLNDAFTGGSLYFPNQNYTLKPKPGLLVAFPSHHGFVHEAQPTESGLRYVVVSWAAAEGVPRVRPSPPWGSHFMRDHRARK